MNGIRIRAATGTNLQALCKWKEPARKHDILYDSTFLNVQVSNSIETENRRAVAYSWGDEETGEWCLHRCVWRTPAHLRDLLLSMATGEDRCQVGAVAGLQGERVLLHLEWEDLALSPPPMPTPSILQASRFICHHTATQNVPPGLVLLRKPLSSHDNVNTETGRSIYKPQ